MPNGKAAPLRSRSAKGGTPLVPLQRGKAETDNGAQTISNGTASRRGATPKLPTHHIPNSTQNKNLNVVHHHNSGCKLRLLFPIISLIVAFGWIIIYITHMKNLTRTMVETGKYQGPMSMLRPGNAEESNGIPEGFEAILTRALEHKRTCINIQKPGEFHEFDKRKELPFMNDTMASLPSFGVIDTLQQYFGNEKLGTPKCHLPPETECDETQFTVVFMAYNPDRLGVTLNQIKKMLNPDDFQNLVSEVVLVWNGPRHIDESKEGKEFLEYAKSNPVRIAYPLKMGFPNDLMNRYHPEVVKVTTKAIMYYDDDGPFYSFKATEGGFELWKRHASAQIGAMSREITYSKRQQAEWMKFTKNGESLTDREFVSHCTNNGAEQNSTFEVDQVDYNYRYFANYNANMVLPSGSFLHSNYLCYLWHPVFADIRQFVLDHPVHPDDMTVSMIVSQLSGRAPRVYSRRLNPDDEKTKAKDKRRLSEATIENEWYNGDLITEDFDDDIENEEDYGIVPFWEVQNHRRLLFNINWDAGAGMNEKKQMWADLRVEAVNSLVRYFGSLNSGSIGWCEGTTYFDPNEKSGKCKPLMAKQGWLPWMNADGTPKDTCP